jgi:hypothetical protein
MWRVLLILALIPAAAFAQPREYYGAIAYSPRSSAHGWSNDHPSRTEAEKTALANCRKFAKDCRALVSFKNACGALAVGSKGYGWASAHTEGSAGIEAMKNCSQHSLGCSVHRLVCTTR